MSEIDSLQHDAARTTAVALTNVIFPLLRPEEVGECRREFYNVMRAALEAYEERRQAGGRVEPSRN